VNIQVLSIKRGSSVMRQVQEFFAVGIPVFIFSVVMLVFVVALFGAWFNKRTDLILAKMKRARAPPPRRKIVPNVRTIPNKKTALQIPKTHKEQEDDGFSKTIISH